MRFAPLVLLAVTATPAFAEPVEDRGYLLGCGPDMAGWGAEQGCVIAASGFYFLAAEAGGSDPAALQTLIDLPALSAVGFTGDLQSMGDVSGEVALTSVTPIADDMFEGNLRALQGDWEPVGEETPFFLRVSGMQWQEFVQDDAQGSFYFVVGNSCADGSEHQGMTISLYPLGGDPEAVACWLVEGITDNEMTLRNVGGDFGTVDYLRRLN